VEIRSDDHALAGAERMTSGTSQAQELAALEIRSRKLRIVEVLGAGFDCAVARLAGPDRLISGDELFAFRHRRRYGRRIASGLRCGRRRGRNGVGGLVARAANERYGCDDRVDRALQSA
jgi:hypothetical protein